MISSASIAVAIAGILTVSAVATHFVIDTVFRLIGG
jgi:hypothetical protein